MSRPRDLVTNTPFRTINVPGPHSLQSARKSCAISFHTPPAIPHSLAYFSGHLVYKIIHLKSWMNQLRYFVGESRVIDISMARCNVHIDTFQNHFNWLLILKPGKARLLGGLYCFPHVTPSCTYQWKMLFQKKRAFVLFWILATKLILDIRVQSF